MPFSYIVLVFAGFNAWGRRCGEETKVVLKLIQGLRIGNEKGQFLAKSIT